MVALSRALRLRIILCNFPAGRYSNLTTPRNSNLPTRTGLQQISLGSCPFAHHYSGNRLLLSFPGGTKMVQFSPFPSLTYCIQLKISFTDGFSHSEISGSKCVCHSPKLIAACHVLHRQPMPRHPPCTLNNLDTFTFISTKCNVLHQQNFNVKEL